MKKAKEVEINLKIFYNKRYKLNKKIAGEGQSLIESEKTQLQMNMEEGSLARLMENVLIAASRLAGTGVCMYDLKDFFRSDDMDRINNAFRGHYCSFCQMVRSLPGGRDSCIKSDVIDAVAIGEAYGRPFFHTCHVGLTELVVPVFYRHQMIAVVFIGQCRLEGETKFETVASRLASFGADTVRMEQYYKELPLVDRSQLLSAAKLLDLSLRYIVENSGREALGAYFKSTRQDYVSQAIRFIEDHYLEGITAKDVVNQVHLNQSYFSRVFNKATGMSIVDYIHHVRLTKAKSLLEKTSIPISSISVNLGYSDQNYFTRTFTRHIGQSPSEYRKSLKKD